ncbi:MAG: hypothetical protein IPO21_08665 [Bacteroidales bacterium]|nr:hypothetical protein [Bacteroidales bacterium]
MRLPIAIIDSRTPPTAISKLSTLFETFCFTGNNSTYEAISCHPDIYMTHCGSELIVAANAPDALVEMLRAKQIAFSFGKSKVGFQLTDSAYYNSVITDKYFIHKQGFTDILIENICQNLQFINVPQAYTRCSLIHLKDNCFISSDKGIIKQLEKYNLQVIYINPSKIQLPPYKNGFIGGCMGVFGNRLFANGNLNLLVGGEKSKKEIIDIGIEIIELHEDTPYDGGGIFFI